VVDAWQAYGALWGSERRTSSSGGKLKANQLQQQTAELKLENERLRRLLDFVDKQPPARLLVARVVAVGASPHSHTLRIARGTGTESSKVRR